MIGVFDDSGNRLPIVWGTDSTLLTLNDDTDPDNWYRVDTVSVADQLDWVSDVHPVGDGMEVYGARKVQKLIVIDGVIQAESIAKLFDMKTNLATYFDAAYLTSRYGWLSSFQTLKFQRPTTDTATYADGLMDLMYVVRPRSSSFPISSVLTANSALFHLELIAADPRAYAQTQTIVERVGAGTQMTGTSSYSTWPYFVFTMTGAGSATFGLKFGSSNAYVIFNLSGRTNGQIVTITPETRSVVVGSTPTDLYVSGDWNALLLPAEGETLYLQNTTNIEQTTPPLKMYYYKSWVA